MKKLILLLVLSLILSCILIGCGSSTTDSATSDTSSDISTDSSTDTSKPSGVCTHDYGEWEVLQAATCLKKGFDKRTCKLCNHVETRGSEAKGHTTVIIEAVEGNCTTDGYTEGSKCSECNEVFKTPEKVPMETLHKYDKIVSVQSQPTITAEGKATFRCSLCDAKNEVTLPKLTVETLNKNDIYKITTTDYNPAVDNIWKVVDGKTSTGGLYGPGDDWFGNIGDKLVIELGQEVVIDQLAVYVCGNYTSGTITIKNAKGQVVKTSKISVNSENTQKQTIINGGNLKAYTIEIRVDSLKWESYLTFKVAEVEIKAAKPDTRLPHDHVYREYVEDTVKATCLETGRANYACYCGLTQEKDTPIIDHNFSVLFSQKEATCTENGRYTYKCETCNDKREKQIYAKGHIYAKLVNYVTVPTNAQKGEAVFKCIGCELTENKNVMPLSLGNVEHLRVTNVLNNSVTLKFNVYGETGNYEVRYSTSPITNDNFANATTINATVTGDGEYTVTLNLSISLNECYYVAIRPYIGENYGETSSIRLGGNQLIPIDYENANVYSGEVLNSFAKMFDEQSAEKTKNPTTVLSKIFTDANDLVLYGSNLSPIVDLEYGHFVSSVYLYYENTGISAKVRWSDTPVDFMAEDSKWDGVYTLNTTKGWNEIKINNNTRYIQVVFKDGNAPYEMLIYGFQNSDGDKIETSIGSLPTIGEMMGMCGFTAIGSGNTPIDSVICTTVLRDYRKVEWGYTISKYPKLASFFNGMMGNFDNAYKNYTQAGINVIPCIQWDLVNTSM